jgi:hypothetical protein
MFRAAHRSSSGALTVFAASGLHMHVVTSCSHVLRHDYSRSPHAYVNQKLQRQLELLMMSGVPLEICWAVNECLNNKFRYKVASCWLFILSHTAMHGSMNIKFMNTCLISTSDEARFPAHKRHTGTCYMTVCSEHHTRHTNTQQAANICHWVKRLVQQEIKLQKIADRCDCESSLITIFQGNNQIKVKVKRHLV